jgi:hypothetical protein
MPIWAFYAFAAAFAATAVPLLQERFKADGFALAFWTKVFVVLLMAPFVIHHGLPTGWTFYFWMAATGVLYCISDVIYFRAIPIVGSGVMTRLLPASVMITFVLWLAIDPSLVKQYFANPFQGAAIIVILLCFVFFASSLKKCPVSWDAIKRVWYVIFAACIGPAMNKLGLGAAPQGQAVYAFIFVQGLFMVSFWGLYFLFRKPIAPKVMLARHSVQTGLILGVVLAVVLFCKNTSLLLADNPAYITVIHFTDALWVQVIYRLTGRQDKSNIWAGLGIVACAMLLVLVKSV